LITEHNALTLSTIKPVLIPYTSSAYVL
jgi:hypothetical protein